jgi:hypothetical protein
MLNRTLCLVLLNVFIVDLVEHKEEMVIKLISTPGRNSHLEMTQSRFEMSSAC